MTSVNPRRGVVVKEDDDGRIIISCDFRPSDALVEAVAALTKVVVTRGQGNVLFIDEPLVETFEKVVALFEET